MPSRQPPIEQDDWEQAECRLRTLMNSSPDFVCFKDGAGRWMEANPSCLKLFHLENVDYRGKTNAELAPPGSFYYETLRRCEACDEMAWQSGEQWRGEEVIPSFSGSPLVVDVIKVPHFHPDGSRGGLSIIGRDISAHKFTETSLRNSEQNLSITLESIGDAVIATDRAGRITRINASAERLTGWSAPAAIGRRMSEVFHIIHSNTREPIPDPVGLVLARGTPVTLGNQTVLLSKDGREYHIFDSAAPIRSHDGQIEGVVLVFSDVTGQYQVREALQRSERDYRMLFEGMIEGFALHEIICDDSGRPVDYRFLSMNPAFARMTGLRGTDVIGKTVMQVLPQTEEYWIERYGRVALTGEPVHFEEFSSALDRHFRVTAFCPQPKQFAVVFEDVTKYKAAESRVARLTQLYAALSQCNQAIVHSTSAGELLPQVCQQVVQLGGMKMAWIGMVEKSTGMVRPVASYGAGLEYLDGIEISTNADEDAGRGPVGTSIRENNPVWCQDFQNHPRTAHWRESGRKHGWVALASLPLNLRGEVVGALAVYSEKTGAFDREVRNLLTEMAYDISFALENYAREAERKLMEEDLREREEWMRYIIQHDPNAIAVLDHRLHYLFVSDRFLQDYDIREADLIGKSHYEVFPEVPESWKAVHKRCLAGAIERSEDDQFQRPDGTITYNRWECRPWYRTNGEIGGIIMYTEVTTERKQTEQLLLQRSRALQEANELLRHSIQRAEGLAVEAQSATRAKSEFLAVMSHELRTPLNGVIGFAELLSETRMNREQKEFVQTILNSGNHLLDVVNDILDFSSIEKGSLPIEVGRFPLAKLMESASQSIRKTALEKGLEFRSETSEGAPDQITGDMRRIRQILINLLGNAVKFTETGSIVLRVTPVDAGGTPVWDFSVEDTGPGIAPQLLGILFNPFTQADSTVHRQYEGTGLGLAISRRLAEAMGGTLTVTSKIGKGSRFTFRLPMDLQCTVSSAQDVSSDWSSKARQEGSLSEPVLVVEDDHVNSILAGKMILSLGYQVEYAANGSDAVACFVPGKYSAILMDMQMPVMDGIEATRQIRQLESPATHVPIIALTANVMPGDKERCLAAGMDDFLAKPFKKSELTSKLDKATSSLVSSR